MNNNDVECYIALKSFLKQYKLKINVKDPLFEIGHSINKESMNVNENFASCMRDILCVMMPSPEEDKFSPYLIWADHRSWCIEDMNSDYNEILGNLLKNLIEDNESYPLKPYLKAKVAHILAVSKYSRGRGADVIKCARDAYVEILDDRIINCKADNNFIIAQYAHNALALCGKMKDWDNEKIIIEKLKALIEKIDNQNDTYHLNDCNIFQILRVIYLSCKNKYQDIQAECKKIAKRNEEKRSSSRVVLESLVLPAYKIALSKEEYDKKKAEILMKNCDLSDNPIVAFNQFTKILNANPSLQKDPEVMHKYNKYKGECVADVKKNGELIETCDDITAFIEKDAKDMERCNSIEEAIDKLFNYDFWLRDSKEKIQDMSRGGLLNYCNSSTINENGQLMRNMKYEDIYYCPIISLYGIRILRMIDLLSTKFHKDQIEAYISKQIFPKNRDQQCSRALKFFLQSDFISSVHIGIPQLEHLLRELAKEHKVAVFTIAKDKTEKMKSMEQILKELENINELKMKDIFYTLKYLFSDNGLNIRNNICHGLLSERQFKEDSLLSNHFAYVCWTINLFLRVIESPNYG